MRMSRENEFTQSVWVQGSVANMGDADTHARRSLVKVNRCP